MAVSLITEASIEAIARLVARPLEVERFRANIVMDTPDDSRDHPEDRWIGRTIVGGRDNAMLHIARATQRCTVVGIDPATGSGDERVFSAIREHRRNRLGAYATVQRTGCLVKGDALTVHH